jgi:hypothetical protein
MTIKSDLLAALRDLLGDTPLIQSNGDGDYYCRCCGREYSADDVGEMGDNCLYDTATGIEDAIGDGCCPGMIARAAIASAT